MPAAAPIGILSRELILQLPRIGFFWQSGSLMETEWYNRAEAIQQRVTQLRDSL